MFYMCLDGFEGRGLQKIGRIRKKTRKITKKKMLALLHMEREGGKESNVQCIHQLADSEVEIPHFIPRAPTGIQSVFGLHKCTVAFY